MNRSNEAARATWERKAVGQDRAQGEVRGTQDYFAKIREYRYGYETPFIPDVFRFHNLKGKYVLEIGVGNGIDAVEMMRNGAFYTGVDVTKNHIDLTCENIRLNNLEGQLQGVFEGDLLELKLSRKFDVIYSFGVLHHISHEEDYIKEFNNLLNEEGELRLAFYSQVSFFYGYLAITWIIKNRMRNSFYDWASHIAEHSELGNPVTIKIRTRSEIEKIIRECGFKVVRYEKKGFVKNYLPFLGKYMNADGLILNCMGSLLGWYHCFTCVKNSRAG